MPLAHTPCWHRPRLELLSSRPLSVAEASDGLQTFLASDFQKFGAGETDASSINVKQVPEVARRLEEDWVTDEQPGPDACFVEVYARLEVHMPPCFLGANLDAGLRRAMAPLLLRHDPTLKCVPLTFSDLKPCGSCGAVVSVSPYVHFLAEFRCVGFAPENGQRIVCRTSPVQTQRGVGVLILNHFAGFVQKSNIHELSWDRDKKAWGRDGKCLIRDQRVWFVISSVKFNDVHANLEGTWEYDANMLGAPPEKRKSAAIAEQVAAAELESEAAKPKKKKRKEQETAEAAGVDGTADEIGSESANPKKKKRKEQETEAAMVDVAVAEIESEAAKPKKKKRRKK